nr:ABC transporter ATP-binding protein [Bacteroidota bacterium]
ITDILNRMVNENKMSVFLIEHNMGFVKQVAHNCHFIHDGCIHASGSPTEVIDDPLVRNTYLGF